MATTDRVNTEEQPHYLSKNTGFGIAKPEDDFLHLAANAAVSDVSLTETQYFGFCVPDEEILGLGFHLHRPNLGVVTGGPWAFQGVKRHPLASELFDIHQFMSDASLQGDLHEYRFSNGYGVKVIEPMCRHLVTYADPFRKNSLELHYEATADAVMFGNGVHFEQLMHVTGELVLRGKQYDVDCLNIRDRSWAKPRQEGNQPLPPIQWVTGAFSKDFAFNCTAFDDPELMPEWRGNFSIPGGKEGSFNDFVRTFMR